MAQTKVINVYKDGQPDIFIGRPSPWGNPYKIGVDGTREEVVEKYRQWIQEQPRLLSLLPVLKGKTLGCFCKPKACHGDVLVELVNALPEEETND